MASVTRADILAALKSIAAPDGRSSIVEQGLVSEIVIANRKVYFAISASPDRAAEMEPIRKAAEAAVKALEGVESANVALTAERAPGSQSPSAAAGSEGAGRTGAAPRTAARSAAIPGIRHIVAVASGKGGVGKSTTAVNLALGLKALGLKAGILDADVYGPSVPRLVGLSGKPQVMPDRRIKPMSAFGLKVMSMGFLIDEGTPVVWRAPMVMQALTQMLREVAWDDLDILVVDMPPGTGDAQLTLAQQAPLSGAVIVSTPQDLALIDARKGLAMFRQVNVPVLGIVENMSYFLCPSCGTRSDIFGHGGAREEAERLGVTFLGEVPLHMTIRETSDRGQPVTAVAPDSPHADIYRDIARKVMEGIEEPGARRAAPRIVME
ncbi:MAG: Mrp/NBP35 family ATP-binding protein [Hyphomicrobiaceae bacterium]